MPDNLSDGDRPFEIVIEPDFLRVSVQAGTVVSADLVMDIIRALYAQQAYRKDKIGALWDLRQCRTSTRGDDLQGIIHFGSRNHQPTWTAKCTAFVADVDATYGMARAYEAQADEVPTEFRVFRDLRDAEAWLRSVAEAARK